MESLNSERDAPMSNVGSDIEFDDDLGVPDSLTVVEVEGSQVVINRDDELDAGLASSSGARISYRSIYNNSEKLKSSHRDIFIPKQAILVQFTEVERHLTSHLLNPNLYTITITHGDFVWTIQKRYKHFLELHERLLLYKTSLNIPLPSKTHMKKRESFKNNAPVTIDGKRRRKAVLPRFPKKPEILVLNEQLDNRMKQLEEYLSNLLAINIYRCHPATIEFLQVSRLSFIPSLGSKGREGLLKKRSGSIQPNQSGFNCFGCRQHPLCLRSQRFCSEGVCARWTERWFFVKDTCFGYIDPKDGRVKCVVLLDQGFEVSVGMQYAAGLRKGFQILTLTRHLVLKCPTRSQRKAWLDTLKDVANTQARDFTQPNAHHSFAPIRTNIDAYWFVDGSGYMSAVADAIEGAKEEIFIADWWLSPEIYLKRPAIGDQWRLDKLLERKALEGVKIFVLLYKELEMALGLNSYYSKQTLASKSENIKVLRHPDHAKVGVFLWAHHEKIVCVDQTHAFLGGIDLCYGRWDDWNHKLTDMGSVIPTCENISSLRKKTSTTPGGDSFYPIPIPAYKLCPPPPVVQESKPSSDDESEDSLPKVQMIDGDHLFIPTRPGQHLKPNTPETERRNPLDTFKAKVKTKKDELINMVYSRTDSNIEKEHEVVIKVDEVEEEVNGAKYWIGKDYCNFIVKDFQNLDSPFVDFIDRVTTPRMPWHDIGVCVQGASARDVARHFIQRWNAAKLEKARLNHSYPYILPKSYSTLDDIPNVIDVEKYKVTCQILRSVSTWSCGFLEPDIVEQSIHDGYIDAITRSQHYIYIENQFFVSLSQQNTDTRNLIAESLYKRILRAHKENATFRVYVVMPLLPGFEGEVGGATGTSLHAITHWNYASIVRGKDSLLQRLTAAGIPDPSVFISFFGLRTHSLLNNEPITELIYVHSKLMIVDDKIVICGSANINDRSLIGKRDSEIAVFIEDEQFDDGHMNNKPYPTGRYAGSLRRHIFREHLGIIGKEHEMINIDVSDPVCDSFYREVWQETAALNTEFYEKVFHCLPSDEVHNFVQLKEQLTLKPLYHTEIARAEQMLDSIKGHLVLLPLNFLKEENLMPASGTVEGMMPTALWT